MKYFRIEDFTPYSELFPKLSKREIEILSLFRVGLTRSEIALKLNVSARTIDAHLNSAMHKYELHSSSELKALFNFIIQDSFIRLIASR
ncbi:helix-turn-helix transcriptional regulator [Arsenophonus sp. ENCA]|uniref:response regulator transcription factor n=1 Tax=Arsenophonus sp. ENCA TaxID=1987579 RepID=UPI000BD4B205|nr:helix-turn-helix transcriptional regulator [Arsenophonus sp. ENCA]PAV11542.1 helix-turn-helix transcriptional regulator [Arsenophonus sp. ENCA]